MLLPEKWVPFLNKLQILHWYCFREPNPVIRLVKKVAILVHLQCPDAKYSGLSVPHPYVTGSLGVGGKVDVMPVLPEEALLADTLERGLGGTVVESFRRYLRR